jgi:hypothetical protein
MNERNTIMLRLLDAVRDACFKRPDLLRPEWRYHETPALLAGHCYVASEALHHLLQAENIDTKPMHVKVKGTSHWFLVTETGLILDATWMQFGAYGNVDYAAAKGKGFLTLAPSKRAVSLMAEVSTILEHSTAR